MGMVERRADAGCFLHSIDAGYPNGASIIPRFLPSSCKHITRWANVSAKFMTKILDYIRLGITCPYFRLSPPTFLRSHDASRGNTPNITSTLGPLLGRTATKNHRRFNNAFQMSALWSSLVNLHDGGKNSIMQCLEGDFITEEHQAWRRTLPLHGTYGRQRSLGAARCGGQTHRRL